MQKVHVRNLFRVYVPLVCPVGHQVDRLTPNPGNNRFGFSLKDTATGQVHVYQLQLYCLADREYAERTYEDWATWGKRHPLSFQKNPQTEEIEGVIIRIKVSHGVFDFRKMKEQLVRISAIYCVDGANKNQGVSALFKVLPKRRHGNDLDSDGGDEVRLSIDWDPLTSEPKPDQSEARADMDTTANIANASHDYYTSPSIESYASSTSYIAPGSNTNVVISNSPQQELLSGHYSDYELLMFPNPNLPTLQQHYSPYEDIPQQVQNENYMVLYNGNAEVIGNFRALNFYKSSDINIKEDIRLLVEDHDCRDTLLKIDGVDYKFKQEVHPDTNRRFVGYIAQQVESVVPEAVQLIDGVLHVDYEALLPYLSESVRANYNDIRNIKTDKTKFHQTFDSIYEEFIQKEKTKKAKKEPVKTKENESGESGPGFSTIWKVIILIAGLAIVGVGAMIAVMAIPGHITHVPTDPLTPAHLSPAEPQDPLIERVFKDLYLSTSGQNWRHNIGWLNKSTPICTWYGVSCTGKSVTKLALQENGLSGTISSSLFELTTLIEVDLSGNHISGTLSSDIPALTQLQVLQLQQNDLTGTIPEELAHMASLSTLRLDNNRFSGTIPASIVSAPQLHEVKLANNTLTGTIPFVNFTHLDVSNNLLEGSLPQFSAVTTNLNIENNKLVGDVANLSNLTGIVSLLMGSNNLTGTLSFSETQLRTIKVLRMAHTSISSIEQTQYVPGRPSFKSCDMSHVPLKCPLPNWAISSCNANCK